MMNSERLAAHMGVSLILFLAAVAGWGAFAYGVSSDRQKERTLREEVTRAATERDRLDAELRQVRAESERNRLALDQARRDLSAVQQQVMSLTEQLKMKDRATSPAPAGPARPQPTSLQPSRPAIAPPRQ